MLRQARDLALLKKEYWADDALERIAWAQAKAGQFMDAENTITLIDSARQDQAWGIVGRQVANAGDLDGALSAAQKIYTISWKRHVLIPVAEQKARQGQFQKAREIAESLADEFASREVMAAIAKVQAQQGDIAGALETASVASRENPYILGGILGEQVKSGDVQGARERALAFKEGGLGSYALLGIVSTQLEQKDLAGAQATAELMKAEHLPQERGRAHATALAWKELALAQTQVKDLRGAKHSVGMALNAAKSMQPSWVKDDIMW
ncbi:MAG: hypothetical protein ACRD2L_26170, partial [Terriglobia bacterium]